MYLPRNTTLSKICLGESNVHTICERTLPALDDVESVGSATCGMMRAPALRPVAPSVDCTMAAPEGGAFAFLGGFKQ